MKAPLYRCVLALAMALVLNACKDSDTSAKLFTLLNAQKTGIDFSNTLMENDSLNYFLYKNLYNGGGVAIGDINNDGLQDIYFTGNMVENKLYLNMGGLKFKDITREAGVGGDHRWTTGVTMADVNQDGWLDIYVCAAGRPSWQPRKNLLYINNGVDSRGEKEGIPTFTESAENYGVADAGNSTQAVFFDYDRDGDLDLYVANYPIRDIKTGVYNYLQMMRYIGPKDSDHLYENHNGKFEDVTVASGIMRFGLSLGVSVADYNQDGWPDLYVSNDFATPDYFFFNNRNGTFTDKLSEAVNYTSFFGMGIDNGDFNNDGRPDILQVDMVPADNFRSKVNMASMDTEVFNVMKDNGMHLQYMKNTLQMNMGLNKQSLPQYAEISQYANAALTDWSWAPLMADLDNDGWKDIFITNGSRREMNNKDFFTEMNKDKEQYKHYLDWVKKMPEQKVKNYALKNHKGTKFSPVAADWGIDFEGWSNGAAYADLDNDGDLELVVNNIDGSTLLYENNSTHHYLRVKLNGPAQNKFGLGAKLTVFQEDGGKQFQELTLTRGFQSSVEPIVHFGMGARESIKKLLVQWPDGKQQTVNHVKTNQLLTVDYKNAESIPKNTQEKPKPKKLFEEITHAVGVNHKHTENPFNDFDYQVLLPHKMSQFGPALAVGDCNHDGLDDFYVGGAKGEPGQLYVQNKSGKFDSLAIPAFHHDKAHEDVDALFFDADGDGNADLYVVSGGNEKEKGDSFYQDRLYLNDGTGGFVKSKNALPLMYESGGVVKAEDFDKDGDLDLFIGSRLLPRSYPLPGKSYLLENNSTPGQAKFTDITNQQAKTLREPGMVTDAVWAYVNNDEYPDLLVTGEWMPVKVFINQKGRLTDETDNYQLKEQTGWWNCLLARDFDGDGDIDVVAGNLGENYKYKASEKEPFSIYANDYDKNGEMDIVLSYTQKGEEYPLRGRQCSAQQIPAIEIKFKDYTSFAEASLADVYATKALDESLKYQATTFSSAYLENKGGHFSFHKLGWLAQLSAVNAIYSGDINQDGHADLVLGGNLYGSEVETPINQASYGLFMQGDGKGKFKGLMPYESGLMIKGEIRKIKEIILKNKKVLIFALNNGKVVVVKWSV